jgi:rhamnogalacturonyl hydrolase YesR
MTKGNGISALFGSLALAGILPACAPVFSDTDGTWLKPCAPGYQDSYIEMLAAAGYYKNIKSIPGYSDEERAQAARDAVNQCVRHFENYGTANCTEQGRAVTNGSDFSDAYYTCKRAQLAMP